MWIAKEWGATKQVTSKSELILLLKAFQETVYTGCNLALFLVKYSSTAGKYEQDYRQKYTLNTEYSHQHR